jgi:hypothetical protein
LRSIEGVDNPIISYPQTIPIAACEPVVWEVFKSHSQIVDLGFNSQPKLFRKLEKRRIEAGVIDL